MASFGTTVIISNLPITCSESEVHGLTTSHGEVQKLTLRKNQGREFYSYAFVTFSNPLQGCSFRSQFNQTAYQGRMISVTVFDESFCKSPEANIYVSNLSATTKGGDLDEFFSQYGDVVSSKVSYLNGESLSYGFVQFKDPAVAQRLVQNPPQELLGGRTIEIEVFQSKHERIERALNESSRQKHLYVRGFPAASTEEDLRTTFAQFGAVETVFLRKSSDASYAIISYATPEDSGRAIEALNEAADGAGGQWVVSRMLTKKEKQILSKKNSDHLRDRNLLVTNIPESISLDNLTSFFTQFGTVQSSKIFTKTNIKIENEELIYEKIPRGAALICYRTPEESDRAHQKLRNIKLENNLLVVRKWKPNVQKKKKTQNNFFYNPYYVQQYQQQMQQMQQMQQGPPPPQSQYPSRFRGRARGRSNPRHAPAPRPPPPVQSLVDTAHISNLSPNEAKIYMGEIIFGLLHSEYGERTGKITGMLLEIPQSQLSDALENEEKLRAKALEAVQVLYKHENRRNK